jgi:hypothetical protein
MVAAKTPNKTSTPTAAKSAVPKATAKPRSPAPAAVEPTPSVVEAVEVVEAPQPESTPVAKPEPVVTVVAAVEPTPEAAPVAVSEPEAAPEPEAVEEAEVAVNEDMDRLASLAEQVVYEAEAMAGEAAHNFQVAFKAATGAQGVVPTLSGINGYLRRSVEINAQFVEQFATVRSPLDLVSLQVNFLEEHRVAMLDFARQWTKQSES